MMYLCLLNKLPTLAVKILLHMRKYKIEIDSITNSYYNKVLIEGDWPSFEHDRWGKLRSIMSVIRCFKYTLELKKKRLTADKYQQSKTKTSKKVIKTNNTSFSSQSQQSLQDTDRQSRSDITSLHNNSNNKSTNDQSQDHFSSNTGLIFPNSKKNGKTSFLSLKSDHSVNFSG
jgi:hypothetical protein